MNTKNLLLAFAATCCFETASAQTTPSNSASQAPATMASPNTSRSSMSTAAEAVGTVVTDSSSRSSKARKSTKIKGALPGGKGKMKTKM